MIFNGNELSYGSNTVENDMLQKLIIYNNVLFLLNDFVGKTAALINQYYEYGTSKGQMNDTDMHNLCYDMISKKIIYIHSLYQNRFIYTYTYIEQITV